MLFLTAQLQTDIQRWIQRHYVKRYLTLRYMENLYRKTQTMNLLLFCLNASKRKKSLIKEGKIKRNKKSAKTSDTPHYENVPFEIPNNWVWTTLGEVGTWQSGGTPSRSNKSYYGGNIPWLKTGDLKDGLISDIPESITEEAVANSSAKINPTGSVLIAMYGATIGKLGILTFPATTNQACCACIEFNAITQLYLFYFLLSQRNTFISKGGGGAQPNISKEIIVNTFVPLPPLSEQQRIVMEIENWFVLIDLIEQDKADLQTTIKQAKNKILDLAIHGKLVPQDPNDEPAIELLKRINPDFTPCDNGHYLFDLPSSWLWCKLGDLCKIKGGKRIPKGKEFAARRTEHIYLRVTNMKNQTILLDDLKYIEDDVFEEIKNYTISSDDLYLTIAGTIGDVGEIPKEVSGMNLTENAAKLTSIICDRMYLMYSLLSTNSQEHFKSKFHQVAQPKLSIETASSTLLPLSPLAEQQRIVQKIEDLFSAIDNIQNALEV